MFTIDASVYINAQNPKEIGSAISRAFIQQVNAFGVQVVAPTLLFVEVAASLARLFDGDEDAMDYVSGVQYLSNYTWTPLDDRLMSRTMLTAVVYRLRGADAVYVAVAQEHGNILVTLDNEQLTRSPVTVNAMRPVDASRLLSTMSNGT